MSSKSLSSSGMLMVDTGETGKREVQVRKRRQRQRKIVIEKRPKTERAKVR